MERFGVSLESAFLRITSSGLPDSRVTVYTALTLHASRDSGLCYPSITTLMKMCHIGNRHTVIDALDDLEKIGLIKTRKEKGKKNIYYLVGYEKTAELIARSSTTPVPKSGTTPVPKNGTSFFEPVPKSGTTPVPKNGTSFFEPVPKSGTRTNQLIYKYNHPTNQSNVVGRREEEETLVALDVWMDGILKNYNEEEIQTTLNQMHETSNTNNRDKERTALNDLLNEGWTLDEIKQCWRVASRSHIENSSERKYWKNLYKWLSGKNKDKTDSARYTLNASKNASNAPKIDANQKNGYKYPETIKHDKCGTESTLEIEAAGGYRCEKCHAVFFPFKKSD